MKMLLVRNKFWNTAPVRPVIYNEFTNTIIVGKQVFSYNYFFEVNQLV